MSRLVLGLLCALAIVPGCVTAGEGERMQGEISKLRERLDAMDKRYRDSNEQMDRLRKVLDEATALLTRNSADLGAKVAKSETDVATLNGKVEEARHMLEQIQQKQNAEAERLASLETNQERIVERVAPTMPEDKDTLWREAQTRVAAGQREDARRFLRAYVQRFPQDARAPEAMILIGKTFALEGKHTQAAGEYQKLMDTYAKSPQVPEAMFQLGLSFVELRFCGDARAILQDLAKRYPKSNRSSEARARIKDITKMSKDRKLCTS